MTAAADTAAAERARAAGDRAIAAIDWAIGRQLDAILHHPAFQELEAAWRGLRWLVGRPDRASPVVVRVLQATWPEICRDLSRAPEFDQSVLFRLIYEEEFGSPGGRPYGLLVGLYRVRHQRAADHPTDDVGALQSLAQVAAAAFAPLLVSAAPALFGLESWRGLGRQLDLDDMLRDPAYQRWLALGQMEEARFLGVTLPRILLRPPHDPATTPFPYAEAAGGAGAADLLWGDPGLAVAAVAVRAFETHRWFADIRGVPDGGGGGVVQGLPAHGFDDGHPPHVPQPPVEVMLTERQDRQLAELGFIPVSPGRFAGDLVLYGNQSLQRPRRQAAAADASARLSAMLQYMLCVSRFAHYIKVMLRDRMGSFATPAELEAMLNEWLNRYSNANDGASLEMKARYPLRGAAATVQESPSHPGRMLCEVRLQPRFQLDLVDAAFRIATEIRQTKAA